MTNMGLTWKRISVSKLINIVLLITLLMLMVFGWLYLTKRNPIDAVAPMLPQVAPPKGEYLYSIYGVPSGSFKQPNSVTVFKNEIYVSDAGNGLVRVFDYNGNFLREFGKGKIKMPRGIAFYNNEIYVTDVGDGQVKIFDMDGKFQRVFEQFMRPVDIVIKDDTFYMTDAVAHQIVIVDNEAKVKKIISEKGENPGQLHYPNGLVVDENNNIWVCDSNNNRVQVFDTSGKLLKVYNPQDSGYLIPRGLSFDNKDYLYTANGLKNMVIIQDQSGKRVGVIESAEDPKDKLGSPTYTFVDQNRRLYVAEMAKNRISVFAMK